MRAFEIITETKRKSAAVKLQGAWERQQAKSTASRQRADQAKAEFEKDWKAKQEKEKQGVAEGASDDPKFQKMMGNIQKNTPDPFSGYVAVSYASEKPSKKIKGATVNGKPLPTTTDDPGKLIKDLKFTSDRIEQQLMAIGKKHGWDLIDPGHGQGYSELYFDTNREYTTNTQQHLATNIVKTVNEINKFFAGMNSSLQATGLPGYRVDVWQGMGANGNTNQFDDINQITNIAKGKSATADPGPAIGRMILKYLPGIESENDELGYDPQDFINVKKVASIYIAKGERAGLEAQGKLDSHVSEMIDELLSDHGGSSLRTIWELDEQGVAEDWNKVNHHDKTNGLSQKAVNAYRREHPGSKLKTAVTTKPSKLKPGSKAAKRRKSFCARMSGNKGPMKKPNGKPTPKALALRRWNCESIEEMQQLIMLGEQYIANLKEDGSAGGTSSGSIASVSMPLGGKKKKKGGGVNLLGGPVFKR